MDATVLRKFGMKLVGDVPWGTHLCQFYETKEDLIDILVPYFAEGLRDNEFCMWITSPPLEVEEAILALRKAIPELDQHIQKRQIEILPYTKWYLLGGAFDADRVLQGWVEKEKVALSRGFDGLRLAGNTFWVESSLWKSFVDYEAAVNAVIPLHRIIALCTYSLEKCTGADVVDVVRNHVGTLIRREKDWRLVEDVAHRKQTEEELVESERRYRSLFANMNSGFAYHKIVLNDDGKPVDYVFLEVNEDFERLTGLRKEGILGKRVTEVLPGIEKEVAGWISIYGKVAITGEAVRFENYSQNLKKWYSISAYSPAKGYFAAAFDDVTERKRAEEEIKRLNAFQKRVFESIKDELMVIDVSNFAVLAANNALLNGVRMEEDEVIGRYCYAVTHRNSARCSLPEHTCPIAEMLRTGKPIVVEHTHYDGEGNPHYVEVSASPVTDKGGNIIQAVHLARDITARKKTEQALRESQKDLNRAQAVAKTGSWRLDVRRDELLWSDETHRMFGIPKGTPMTYETFLSAVHPDDSKYVNQKWKAALQGEPYDIEHRIIVSGEAKWVRERAELEFGKDGTLLGGFGTVQDITERKQTEQELVDSLNASQRRQSEVSALLKASEAVLRNREFKQAARLIFDSCKELLGATAGYVALLSKDEEENEVLFLDSGGLPCKVDPSLPMPVRGLRAEAYRTGKVVYSNDFPKSEWTSLMPEGHVELKNVLFAPLTMDKKTVGIIGLANKPEVFTERDALMALAFGGIASVALINSRMLEALEENEKLLKAHSERLEELVEERTKQLKDAERLVVIGQTAGMVGHDIRNPLQSIIGDVYLAKMDLGSLPDSEEKESVRESLEAIGKQTEYINKIVLDLQDFAKPLNPHAEETDLERLIEELLVRNGVVESIQTDAKVDIDAKKVMADSAYMRRIMGNLISNAVQAMPNGGKLAVRACRKAGDVVITVEDTGVGIPDEAKPKLFQPLFTTKSKGQGFGLAVVKRLTEALNGTITFDSEEGKGTKFTIKLPVGR
jgi:PAS domain S-box-containing protein